LQGCQLHVIGVGADAARGGAWCLPLTGAAALTGAPLIIAIGVTGGLAIWGLWSLIGWCVDKYRQMEMDKKMHALKASFDVLLRTIIEIQNEATSRFNTAQTAVHHGHVMTDTVKEYFNEEISWESAKEALSEESARLEKLLDSCCVECAGV
jgi:pantothenate kinase